jgi:hypothetical protein
MLNYVKDRFSEISTLKGVISLVGGVLIWVTPDKWDIVIEMTLAATGVTDIFVPEKKGISTKKK